MYNSLYETEEEKRRRLAEQQTTQPLEEMTTRDVLEHAYDKANPNGGYITMTGPLGDFSFYDEDLNTNKGKGNPILRDDKRNTIGNICESYLQIVPEHTLNDSPIGQIKGAIRDNCENYINMVNANLKSSNEDKLQGTTIDNYAHCLANYNSAKRGNWGRLTTKVIGNTREALDYAKNILNKNPEYASHDFKNDTTINRISINRADSNMYNTSQEACSRFKPKLLDEEKYKKWYRR